MPQNINTLPLFIKSIGVILGAIFALTLTGDIDKDGKLKLNFSVAVRLAFSAYLGFVGGAWLIEYKDWGHYSYASHGFIMMMTSVFGMAIVGVIYQAFILSTTNKNLGQIVLEIKNTFKAMFK